MPLLQLRDVGFAYRGGGAGATTTAVLTGVSLEVAARELVCLVGPNGSGKSTLLRLAAGLLAPSDGQVRVGARDPATGPRRELARELSYLPQSYQLGFPFRAGEVVLMGRYAHARRGFGFESAADHDLAAAAMARCDVAALATRRFDTLSGGEQRRVLLAQAFCQAAGLILFDEPTSALDPAHAIALFTALRAEIDRRAAAALVVTHDLQLAARFADRVVVLDGGRVVGDGAPLAVLGSPATARAFRLAIHVGQLADGALPYAVPGG